MTAKDCRKCKSFKDCEGHFYIVDTEAGKQYVSWYHYGEIRWCPYQIILIILNSGILIEGSWPESPEISSYTDPMIKTGYACNAYFVKPVGILAEVNYRLERTGVNGKLLRAEVLAGMELSGEAQDALMYVKGRRGKSLSYQRWKTQNRYRGKNERSILSR